MKSSGTRVLADDAKRYGWPTCPAIVRSGTRVGEVCGNVATCDDGKACPYHCLAFRQARRRGGKLTKERRDIRKRVRAAILALAKAVSR